MSDRLLQSVEAAASSPQLAVTQLLAFMEELGCQKPESRALLAVLREARQLGSDDVAHQALGIILGAAAGAMGAGRITAEQLVARLRRAAWESHEVGASQPRGLA